jgi:hypothetical protein
VQRLQTQPAIGANNDLDLVAFLQSGLAQAIGGEPHCQAVASAADRLLEVAACINRSALGLGLRQGIHSAFHGLL